MARRARNPMLSLSKHAPQTLHNGRWVPSFPKARYLFALSRRQLHGG